jgi:nucleoside-diphosphate-sugar epimerase
MRVLIVGCGYVGLPLGSELVRQGHAVFGLRRSVGTQTEMNAAGIQPLVDDITKEEDLARLPGGFDWVVNTVSSSRGGEEEYRQIYLDGTSKLVKWLSTKPIAKFVYTSSTSVYGQNDGSLFSRARRLETRTRSGRGTRDLSAARP